MKRLLNVFQLNFNQVSKRKLGNRRTTSARAPGKLTIDTMPSAFHNLLISSSTSLVKKHLSQELYSELTDMRTPFYGSTLLDCIRCSLKCRDCSIGIYAPDVQAYNVFKNLFNPIIEDLHNFRVNDQHPISKFGSPIEFPDIDPKRKFVYCTRMRALRNLSFYPLAPKMTEYHYKRLSHEIVPTLLGMEDDLMGTYYPQWDTPRSLQLSWIEKHLFKDTDRFMEAGRICKYQPVGRGFFHNVKQTYSVWVNFEDQLRIVSMQLGANFGEVYQRLINGLKILNENHEFYRDQRLGYVTCSPENLGTALRISVLIKLNKLSKNPKLLNQVLSAYGLQLRGTYGKNTPVQGNIYDISNKRTLGITEYDSVNAVYDGVKEIIAIEK